MRLKAIHEHPRVGHLVGPIKIRRKPKRHPSEAAAPPRVWSLLLPPRYPADRR
jgi:hypothetical protein